MRVFRMRPESVEVVPPVPEGCDGMEDLIRSIEKAGVLVPVSLRALDSNKVELVDGRRRVAAAVIVNKRRRELGQPEIGISCVHLGEEETADPPRIFDFYFGCVGDIGHRLGIRRKGTVGLVVESPEKVLPKELHHLDSHFCPGVRPPLYQAPSVQPEGLVRTTWVSCTVDAEGRMETWTILSWWDRLVDGRHGSHSTFGLRGEHTYDAALTRLHELYPAIFARYDYNLHLGAGQNVYGPKGRIT